MCAADLGRRGRRLGRLAIAVVLANLLLAACAVLGRQDLLRRHGRRPVRLRRPHGLVIGRRLLVQDAAWVEHARPRPHARRHPPRAPVLGAPLRVASLAFPGLKPTPTRRRASVILGLEFPPISHVVEWPDSSATHWGINKVVLIWSRRDRSRC